MTRRFPAALLFVLASSAGLAAFSLVSVDQEIAIGREAQQSMRSKVPELSDEEVTRYVSRLGRRLAAQAPGPRYPYSFSVANDRALNAFALPGGPVWVHRGVLDAAENEAQVAGVLAHEIAHVAERHAAEQMTKATVANGLLGLLGSMLDGGRSEAGVRIGAGLGTQFLFLKFSRNHEREADQVGAAILRRAGYDPNGMAEFFDLLARRQRRSPGSVATFLSTHPAPGERAADLRRASAGGGGRRTSAEFTAMKRELRRLPPAAAMSGR